MMFSARIHSDQLAERLDAEYFTPAYVAAENAILGASKRLGKLKTLDQIRDASTGLCYGVLQPRFVAEGVPAIEIGDLATGVLRPPHLRISRKQHHEYRRSAVVGGDVLISVKGTLGVTAIAPNGLEESNVNRDIARLRVRQTDVDPYYLVCFLRSSLGGLSLQRVVRGTIQRNLNIGDLVVHPVLVPDLSAQRYVGDKVRLAERLRERARSLRREIEDQLSIAALVAALSTNEQRANRVSASDLSPRLDSKYYGSRSMAVLHAAAANSVSVGALVEEVSNGFEHRDFAAEGTPYITVTEVSGGRLVLGTAPRLGAEVSIPKKAQLDTCCALVVRTGSIGVAVPVFEEDTHAAISSHLIRLRFKTEKEAAVVAAFLNSEAGRVLQRKISYGAVQPQIGQDELLALPVPKTLLDSAESILKLLTTEDAALRAARRLTASATLLVEHLIEGKVTEADLSAAQRALESGDRGLDRAILQALREKGNPVQPLIADLDGLYALLDELDAEANA